MCVCAKKRGRERERERERELDFIKPVREREVRGTRFIKNEDEGERIKDKS